MALVHISAQHLASFVLGLRRSARRWRRLILLCCLTVGVAWQGAPAAVEAQEEVAMHVVRYGETLSEIAQSYQVSLDDLMGHNAIADADAIYVGQTLAIPLVAEQPEVVQPETQAEAPTATERSGAMKSGLNARLPVRTTSLNDTHTVQPGETLGWIALRYGVDLAALRAVNDLAPGDAIQFGEQLILPATEDELRVQAEPLGYTVQPGDNLSLIAQEHGVPMEVLMAVNRIADADLIQPGQELSIPRVTEEQRAPQVGPALSGFHYHNVRVGETLSGLARAYDSTPQAIVRYNDLPDTETVFSGLEVRIPFGPPILERRRPPVRHSGTEFVVSLSRQRCWVLRGDRVLHEWKCSTGQGEWITRTGTYPVKTKMEMAQSSAYRLDMPFWLGLYDVGEFENGIHGLPVDWETGEKLWDSLIGQPATFGCAMLMDEDAETLFDLAYIGMPVHIVE